MQYAVMGNPIAHSLSPGIHQQFADSVGLTMSYDKLLVEDNFEHQVLHFFKTGGSGLNITSPYKEQAYRLSDVQTPRCMDAKSANTLWMHEGLLHADNTDGIGLYRSLQKRLTLSHARILIIGAGGAARGIIQPLLNLNAEITLVNRTYEKAHELQHLFSDTIAVIDFDDKSCAFDLILNASSFNLDISTLPDVWLKNKPLCYDLAYHHSGVTPFVAWARHHGCEAQDGYDMLVEQAAEAFFVWHGVRPQSKKA